MLGNLDSIKLDEETLSSLDVSKFKELVKFYIEMENPDWRKIVLITELFKKFHSESIGTYKHWCFKALIKGYFKLDKYSELMAVYREQLIIVSDDLLKTQIYHEIAELYYFRFSEKKDLKEGIKACKTAIELGEETSKYEDTLALLNIKLGKLYLELKEYAKSATCFSTAIQFNTGQECQLNLQLILKNYFDNEQDEELFLFASKLEKQSKDSEGLLESIILELTNREDGRKRVEVFHQKFFNQGKYSDLSSKIYGLFLKSAQAKDNILNNYSLTKTL